MQLLRFDSGRYVAAHPRFLVWLTHILIFVFSGVAAFLLRFELALPRHNVMQMVWAIAIWLVVKTIVFRMLALDRGEWRYASVPDILHTIFGNVAASTLALPLILLLAPPSFPRSVLILDLIICSYFTCGARLVGRVVGDYVQRKSSGVRKPVVIYGAGNAGVILLSELRKNPRLAYDVRGFIDDNPKKVGQHIQRVPILGSGRDLPTIAGDMKIDEVLVAIPSASGAQMARILEECHRADLGCKTIPGMGDIIEGRALSGQIREVAVEDLLGREAVKLDDSAIRQKIAGRVVMVTGAAGSIGSELCRQIARFSPKAIVGYEVAETPLFEIDREMKATFPDVTFCPEIGSIQNRRRLDEVLEHFRPSVIYHAAAYKHVPMMEAHIFEAAENNVLGTFEVASAAAEYGVEDFVMISSDKAVRPTNVMGTTKRVAELIIKSLQDGNTNYVSVRFGNVLGSNGSVIPIFKKQIAARQPITVTHPDMQRYFMTIPEAAQLVLQAATMGKGGEIFVLDMGEPVKIVDLAKNLILLSGLRPDEDIKIEFSGVRPGEKLYEELSMSDENMCSTYHEKINVFSGPGVSYQEMQERLAIIRRSCIMRDARQLFLQMKELVPDYKPSGDILARILGEAEPELELAMETQTENSLEAATASA